jgi:hypothetical protein
MKIASAALLPLLALAAVAQPAPTELFLRGYSVIPAPQKVALLAGDIRIDGAWTYYSAAQPGIAVHSLVQDFRDFHGIELKPAFAAGPQSIALRVTPGSVKGAPAETAAQAYHLLIAPGRIEITANGESGLLYAVQTLVQLVKPGPAGQWLLPECEIDDWPRLPLRFLHWDTKHHQDRMPTLKRYLDWAVRFKANMIGFELEDKFSYPSNPIIGAPGAFTPAELQEIVNYGLERHLQVVPVIQSPAHMAYVLKHPQYAHLRADGNNYQSDLCKEETYKLIFQMYDDVIAATKGVDYFFVSTDEVYYAGIGESCKATYNPDNRSAAWADFAIRARDHLAQHNRRMLAWIEYPLLDKDMERIPNDVIDGVVGDESFVPIQKKKGMRQLIYTSTQGAEFLFPDHFAIESLPSGMQLGEYEAVFTSGRISMLHGSVVNARAWGLNPIGVFAAAWGDSGLHSETFWLGWSAVARWGWNPASPGPEQHSAEFMRVYYGPGEESMIEVYRDLQRQARSWQRAWDRVVSRVRKPGYGNSDGPGIGTARHDLTLAAPPLPDPQTLAFKPAFSEKYKGLLAEAPAQSLQNDRLRHALATNMLKSSRNSYNLEVLLALARFTSHHWELISGLGQVEKDFARAAALSAKGNHDEAVGYLVAAHNRVARIERGAAETQKYLTSVFEKSRYPKGREVNGRKFVHVLDDTKDHWADRTADLGYMFAPEESIGLADWRTRLGKLTHEYAARHKVPIRGLAEARLEE